MSNEHAFPFDFTMEPSKGLTKREYIAAMILASMWNNLERATTRELLGVDVAKQWAETSVRAADALLEELQK